MSYTRPVKGDIVACEAICGGEPGVVMDTDPPVSIAASGNNMLVLFPMSKQRIWVNSAAFELLSSGDV